MADTFLDSFNKAFGMAHTISNDERLQQVAQQQMQLHNMQMLKYAAELSILNNKEKAQQDFSRALEPTRTADTWKQVQVADPNNLITQRPEELVPGQTRPSDVTQSILSQYPEKSKYAAMAALDYAKKTGDHSLLDKITKIPVQEKYIQWDPTKSLIKQEPGGEPTVVSGFEGTPKDKTPSTIELITQDLTTKLGRPPTPGEVLKESEGMQIRITGAKAGASERGKNEANVGLIDDATIKDWARYVMTKGEYPAEATRFFRNAGAQADINNRVQSFLRDNGVDGADRAVQSASFTANKQSLNFQEKQRGAAASFVTNINGQVDKIEGMMKDVVSRVGLRALDMPIRELKTRFAGSGQERALESYLMEVSREIGKLSTGSQASIAELSVEAQKKWDKIHDPNLSFKELKEVLSATRDQANIRMKSIDSAIVDTKKRLQPGGTEPPVNNFQPFDVKLPPGVSAEGIAKELEKRLKKRP
jgi:hypothetical protein